MTSTVRLNSGSTSTVTTGMKGETPATKVATDGILPDTGEDTDTAGVMGLLGVAGLTAGSAMYMAKRRKHEALEHATDKRH